MEFVILDSMNIMSIIKKSSGGFTLVEIMIVVAIIALLTAMAIPAFNKVREVSQAKACVNNLRQIVSAKDQYFLEYGEELSVALSSLIAPDGYIKAMPRCPAVGSYTDPLVPDTDATCDSSAAGHVLPVGA